jgi:hypothetical protein
MPYLIEVTFTRAGIEPRSGLSRDSDICEVVLLEIVNHDPKPVGIWLNHFWLTKFGMFVKRR